MAYTYKGIPCLKNPIDLAIYSKAIWDLKPATIIELGSNAGGSALWFADTLERFYNPARVVSIDLNVPSGIKHDRITFLTGDVSNLTAVLQDSGLLDQPRPWLVVEDSAHTYDTCLAVLKQLSKVLQSGDMLVMEDGVLDDLGLTDKYRGGPNRALHEWFTEQPNVFTVDRTLCDMFGRNATYAPNAWLRKN